MRNPSKLLVFFIVIGSGLWSLDAAAVKPAGGAVSYAGQNLGVLLGDRGSRAWDVNDQGSVVGESYGDLTRAFYWNSGTMSDISTPQVDESKALAISGGATEYAVGWERTLINNVGVSHAMIWIAPPSIAAQLDAQDHCQAHGINDAGTKAVGYCPGTAGVIWELGGTTYPRTDIALPSDKDWGWAEDINNEGIVVGFVSATGTGVQTAYLRLADGSLINLPPDGSDLQSLAHAVSNTQPGDIVYVAGSTHADLDFSMGRGIRWRVNLGSRTVTGVVLNQAWAEGVNDAGDVAGTTNSTSKGGTTIKQLATLWRAGVYFSLKAPKGGSDSTSRGQSQSYVVGESNVGGKWVATRWKVVK